MAYLVLDLDLTAIASINQINMIHPFHTLSDETFTGTATETDRTMEIPFKIINPIALANLIETAYTKHDGVIILTSGCWNSSIRTILADNLPLSPEVKQKLRECHFHSTETDKAYFDGLNASKISLLGKNVRLQKIIAHTPELSSKHFAALDDNYRQVDALKKHPKVQATHATTDEKNDSFYNQTLYSLDMAKTLEPGKARADFFTKPNCITKYTLDDLQSGLIKPLVQKKQLKNSALIDLKMVNSLVPSKARVGFFSKPNRIIKCTLDDLRSNRIKPLAQKKQSKNSALTDLEMANTLVPSKAQPGFFTNPNHTTKRTLADIQSGLIEPFVPNKRSKNR